MRVYSTRWLQEGCEVEREHLASSPSSVLDSTMYVLAWTRETLSQQLSLNVPLLLAFIVSDSDMFYWYDVTMKCLLPKLPCRPGFKKQQLMISFGRGAQSTTWGITFKEKLSPYPHLSFGAVQSPRILASFFITSVCPFTVFCLPHFCVWTIFFVSLALLFPSAPRAAVSFLLTS